MNLRLKSTIIAKQMKVEKIAKMMKMDLTTFFFKLNGYLPLRDEEKSQVEKILGSKQDNPLTNN